MRSWLLDLNLIAQASCSRHQRHFDALLGAQAVASIQAPKLWCCAAKSNRPAGRRFMPRSSTPIPWLESG